jgi:hypothetical protein
MSIAQYFSFKMNQELPDIDDISLKIFSQNQDNLIMDRLNTVSLIKRKRILFSLLQCKDLANKIPDSMIKESYKKHRDVLSTVRKTPQEIINFVRQYARQFASSVSKYYSNITPLALTTAPYECTRSQGGTRSYLEPNLVFNRQHRIKTLTRIDPVVIHLTGKPGIGKSFISEFLIRKLADAFSIRKENARYSRSMACEHWDGYEGQLIAQIDDIFTERDGTKDAKQLIQMCSNAQWVVPMADLKSKGKLFNSEFLILSSNQRFQNNAYINCDEAINRRVYRPAFFIESFNKKTGNYIFWETNSPDNMYNQQSHKPLIGDLNYVVNHIFNYSMKTYNERIESLSLIDDKQYKKIFMPIVQGKEFEFNCGYEYDPCPNSIPIVKAHAIPEPLKVRMITKGEAQNWVLKPLQKAMHKALKDFPCFRLTSGQSIINNFKKAKCGMDFLSGDYSAATDNLNMDIMYNIVDELIKVLPKEIIPFVLRESGPHLIEYPKDAQLEPVLQTNGQLMGSLLSFPILCVANAATYGIASNCEDLVDLQCLINGDDIVFRDYDKVILRWKNIASKMGLIPSVGKNYQAKDWFTINSQFVYCGCNSNNLLVNPSESFNLLWSHKATKGDIDTLRESCKRFDKGLIVKQLKSQLRKTPRSLDISTKHGGLGIEDTRQPTQTDCEINLMCYLKNKIKLLTQCDEWCLVEVPKIELQKLNLLDLVCAGSIEGQYPPKRPSVIKEEALLPTFKDIKTLESESVNDEWRDLHNFRKFYNNIPELRNFIRSKKLLLIKDTKKVNCWLHRTIYDILPKHSIID